MSDPSSNATSEDNEDLGGSLFFLLIAINIFACGCAYNYFYGNRCGLNHRRYYDNNRDGGGGGNATTNNNDPPGAGPQDAVGGVGLGGMTLEDRKEFVANALKTEKFVPDASQAACNTNNASSTITNPFASGAEHQQQQLTSDPAVAQSVTCMDVEAQRNENAAAAAAAAGCSRIHQQEGDEEDLDAHQQCAICIEKFHPGEEVCRSHNRDCPHVFHRSCISSWLLSHEDCPCCRRKYLDFESDNEDDGEKNATASM